MSIKFKDTMKHTAIPFIGVVGVVLGMIVGVGIGVNSTTPNEIFIESIVKRDYDSCLSEVKRSQDCVAVSMNYKIVNLKQNQQ